MKKLFGEALRANILDTKAPLIDVLDGGAYVGNGIFASSRKALLKKTGWTARTIRVPCWTKSVCHDTGLCGAFNSTIEVVRWHTNMVTGEYVGYPG